MNSGDTAYKFYSQHIYDKEKFSLFEKHNFKISGTVNSALWELFGALLTGRARAGTTGADLQGWEVKSAKKGGSFEYQYHRDNGALKLKDDCLVNHLFCTYSESYKDVDVKIMMGKDLAGNYFNAWVDGYHENYKNPNAQRYRKNIPYGYIQKNGILIMQIEDGKLIYKNDIVILSFKEK